MDIIETNIAGVILFRPKIYRDNRGYFFESYRQEFFDSYLPNTKFIQENEARSTYGVLRGLHFQRAPHAQAKLIRAVKGTILDIVVDIREGSPTFGEHLTIELSEENKLQLFIPQGFAHGYVVMSSEVIVQYKCDNYYAPTHEGGICWNDPDLNINPIIPTADIILSERDKKWKPFKEMFRY